MKRSEGDRLIQPEGTEPGGVARGLSPRCKDQHPLFAVGDKPKGHASRVKQFRHTGGWIGLPVLANHRMIERLRCRIVGDEQLGLSGCVGAGWADEGEVWPEGFAHLRDVRFQSGWQCLTFGDQVCRISEERS